MSVSLPNQSRVSVTHIGTVHLTESLILSNVLYVPFFTYNLVSVSILTAKGSCYLTFYHDFCFIQDSQLLTMIGRAKKYS
ncbi:hypothetical protein J0J22_23655, partial [Vibrio vulnificus]|nr:hypothetical protein [Vibrio vulnificus]